MKIITIILILLCVLELLNGYQEPFPASYRRPFPYNLTNTKFAGIQMGDKYYLIEDGKNVINYFIASNFIDNSISPQINGSITICPQSTCSIEFVNVTMQTFENKLYFYSSSTPTTFYQCSNTSCTNFIADDTILLTSRAAGELSFDIVYNRIFFTDINSNLKLFQMSNTSLPFPPLLTRSTLVTSGNTIIDTVSHRILSQQSGVFIQYSTSSLEEINRVDIDFIIQRGVADSTRNCYYILGTQSSNNTQLILLAINYSDLSTNKSIIVKSSSTPMTDYNFWITNDEFQGQIIINLGDNIITFDTTKWTNATTGNEGIPQLHGIMQIVRPNPTQKQNHYFLYPFTYSTIYLGNMLLRKYSSLCPENCNDDHGYCVNLQCTCNYGYGGSNTCTYTLLKVDSVESIVLGGDGNIVINGDYLDQITPTRVKINNVGCTFIKGNRTQVICKPSIYPSYVLNTTYDVFVATYDDSNTTSTFNYLKPSITSKTQNDVNVKISFSNFPNTESPSVYIDSVLQTSNYLDFSNLPNSLTINMKSNINTKPNITISTPWYTFNITDFSYTPVKDTDVSSSNQLVIFNYLFLILLIISLLF